MSTIELLSENLYSDDTECVLSSIEIVISVENTIPIENDVIFSDDFCFNEILTVLSMIYTYEDEDERITKIKNDLIQIAKNRHFKIDSNLLH